MRNAGCSTAITPMPQSLPPPDRSKCVCSPSSFVKYAQGLVKHANDFGASKSELASLSTALIDAAQVLHTVAERSESDCRCRTLPPPTKDELQHARGMAEMASLGLWLLKMDRCKLKFMEEEQGGYPEEVRERLDMLVKEHMASVVRLKRMGFVWEPLLQLVGENADAEGLTSGATAFLAMVRLGLVPKQESIVVHIVGAEQREGRTIEETIERFYILVQLLRRSGTRTLSILFVGPQVEASLRGQTWRSDLGDACGPSVELKWSGEFYHEWWEQRGLRLDASCPVPDLILMQNSGIWTYEQWRPTIEFIVKRIRRPLAITAYSFYEAIKDEMAISGMGVGSWAWRPEANPYQHPEWMHPDPDKVGPERFRVRFSKSVANSAWQCIWAGAREPMALEAAAGWLSELGLLRPASA